METGIFRLLFEALGVLQCADGALRLRQVGFDGVQCAEHGLNRGRLVHGRPAGDGNAAARFERTVDFDKAALAVGEEHEAEQGKQYPGCPL
ncbi:MAG: hypothetical protein HY938_07960 [Nitrosomonadales bacterium]|nr:hypothetical protein [Nitrosomonadales bacterium]